MRAYMLCYTYIRTYICSSDNKDYVDRQDLVTSDVSSDDGEGDEDDDDGEGDEDDDDDADDMPEFLGFDAGVPGYELGDEGGEGDEGDEEDGGDEGDEDDDDDSLSSSDDDDDDVPALI